MSALGKRMPVEVFTTTWRVTGTINTHHIHVRDELNDTRRSVLVFREIQVAELNDMRAPRVMGNESWIDKSTILFAVPTMYNRLIQLAAEYPPTNPSLKFGVSGGASLPVEFLHRFESLFHTKIYEGYGLTEAPVCVENPYDGLTKPGSDSPFRSSAPK